MPPLAAKCPDVPFTPFKLTGAVSSAWSVVLVTVLVVVSTICTSTLDVLNDQVDTALVRSADSATAILLAGARSFKQKALAFAGT